MPLSTKVRLVLAATSALKKLGLVPDTRKTIGLPVDKRLAMGPGQRMVGPVPDVPSRDLTISTRDGATITVRVYEPVGARRPVLYAHGGGFFVGGLRSCDHICRRLAVESHSVVMSVEYRLAPEHPFPGPLDDVEDALTWLRTQDWDHQGLVLAGDSAGGNLAAALALRLREAGTPAAGQLLIYPVLDLTASLPSVLDSTLVGLTYDDCVLCAHTYLQGADPRDPYASPLHAADLTGSSPALVITVEVDPLRDEGIHFVERLREAEVPVRHLDIEGHAHASLSLPSLYDGIDDLYEQMVAFIEEPSA